MANLVEFFAGNGDSDVPGLNELRLGSEPAMVMAFTGDAEETSLHWVQDESVKTYVVCPGAGCPLCHLGNEAVRTMLLPVLDVENREVRVLRIPMRRQAGSLGACLTPHLVDEAIAQRVLIIRRIGSKYAVTARPFQPLADRGEDIVRDFLEAQKAGLRLDSALRHMTPRELAEVPSIANKLAALGSWQEPEADAP